MQLGKILLCMGYITDEQLEEVLNIQQQNPGSLIGLLLINQGAITEQQLSQALEAQAVFYAQNSTKELK